MAQRRKPRLTTSSAEASEGPSGAVLLRTEFVGAYVAVMLFRESPRSAPAGRYVATAAYLTVARHLPWSPRPGGKLGQRARRALVERMLDSCGEDVNVEHGAWFGSGAGVSLGDRSDIGMDALVIGPVSIGADVMMGPRCVLVANSHCTDRTDVPMNSQGFAPSRPIVIGDDVWLGAGVTVLPGVRIGCGSVVGAGSVVAHDVPPFSVAAGNPAVVKRSRVRRESVG